MNDFNSNLPCHIRHKVKRNVCHAIFVILSLNQRERFQLILIMEKVILIMIDDTMRGKTRKNSFPTPIPFVNHTSADTC